MELNQRTSGAATVPATDEFLAPFAAVVVSEHTNGHITAAALSSLHKFLMYNIIKKEAARAPARVACLCFSEWMEGAGFVSCEASSVQL